MPKSAHDAKLRNKSLKSNPDRWDPEQFKKSAGDFAPDLAELYLNTWDLSKSYYLENSPPEMLYYREVVEEFKKVSAGLETNLPQEVINKEKELRIAVVVLVRSPCNNKDDDYVDRLPHFYDILTDVKLHGGDAFLLRYEDICSSAAGQDELNKELAEYLPGFGHLHFDAVPGNPKRSEQRRRMFYSHEATSCRTYCTTEFVPTVRYRNTTTFSLLTVSSSSGNSSGIKQNVSFVKDHGRADKFFRAEYIHDHLTADNFGAMLEYFGYDLQKLS